MKETHDSDYQVHRTWRKDFKVLLTVALASFWIGFLIEWWGYGHWQQWLAASPLGIPNVGWLFIASIFLAVIFIK